MVDLSLQERPVNSARPVASQGLCALQVSQQVRLEQP